MRFVNTTRADCILTAASKSCSAHFTEDAVDETVQMKQLLGIDARYKLKEGAVPTFKAPTIASPNASAASVASGSSVGHAESAQTGQDAGSGRRFGGSLP